MSDVPENQVVVMKMLQILKILVFVGLKITFDIYHHFPGQKTTQALITTTVSFKSIGYNIRFQQLSQGNKQICKVIPDQLFAFSFPGREDLFFVGADHTVGWLDL